MKERLEKLGGQKSGEIPAWAMFIIGAITFASIVLIGLEKFYPFRTSTKNSHR